MVALDALVVTTALPTIRVHLGASIEQLEWTVNAYTLSFAVLLMTGAALGDRFGRRRLFAAGLGLFSLASAACALAPSVSARQLGGVFGIATLVAVFTGAGSYGSAQLFSDGFTAALGVAAGLSLLGAVASLGLPALRRQVATVSAPSVSEIATSIE